MNRTTLATLPDCQLGFTLNSCPEKAQYDTVTRTDSPARGRWAFACPKHFREWGPSLQERSELVTLLMVEEVTP